SRGGVPYPERQGSGGFPRRTLLGEPPKEELIGVMLAGRTVDGEEVEVAIDDRSLRRGEIEIQRSDLSEVDLSPLQGFGKALALSLRETQIEEVDLTPLSENCVLYELSLESNQLRRIDLTPLQSCQHLLKLWLGGNRLQTIDLSPLSHCNLIDIDLAGNQLQSVTLAPFKSLRTLNLQENRIERIDLSPLNGCLISHLRLSGNQIREIDLSPLRFSSVEQLDLDHNEIQTIDLSPLSESYKLDGLDLSNNQIEKIDLSPLVRTRPRSIDLTSNNLEVVDVSAVLIAEALNLPSDLPEIRLTSFLRFELPKSRLGHRSKDVFTYVPPAEHRWSYIRDIFAQRFESIDQDYAFRCFLTDIDLHTFNALDDLPETLVPLFRPDWLLLRSEIAVDDLAEELPLLRSDLSWKQVRSEILKALLPQLCRQIDDGGPVIFLTLERVSEFAEIAKRLESISELKRQEMERVLVPVYEEFVDLRPLWLTAHGFEVLSSLGVGLGVKVERFKTIKKSLREIGFKVGIKRMSPSQEEGLPFRAKHLSDIKPYMVVGVELPIKMSQWMKSHIWTIAMYSAEGWPLP
ncbi:MAG: leucine-rich repeat domain-containing protein, partial [Thermoplasmata archaeon]